MEAEKEKRNKETTIWSNIEKEITFFLFKQDISSLMNYLNIYILTCEHAQPKEHNLDCFWNSPNNM